jgi:phosphoribosylformylglycinamidine synthase
MFKYFSSTTYYILYIIVTGYELPWEASDWTYPPNFASPCEIAIEASNGASDYGNKFGEPVIAGFSRSFGMLLGNKERREWIKPIMFSGGIGSIDCRHACKHPPETGLSSFISRCFIYALGLFLYVYLFNILENLFSINSEFAEKI